MAYSSTVALKTVWGNSRVAILSCVADGVSGAIAGGGIGYLFAATMSPISMATTASGTPRVKVNLDATSAVAAGSVFISNVASGDVFYLTLYGRS